MNCSEHLYSRKPTSCVIRFLSKFSQGYARVARKRIPNDAKCLCSLLFNVIDRERVRTALETDEYLEINECLSRLSELFGEVKKAISEVISSFHSKPETMMALGGLLWYLGQLNLDRELLSCDNVWVISAK
ncbi:hypothetical protein DFH28DRAFT_1192787 [Melampsora americana]|nr:hypothetical protein DFH28DRAFT_1192787 [Melampsora americana]